MAGYNSVEWNMYRNLSVTPSNEQQFRLYKIHGIKNYFVAEIKERKLISQSLSKYIASFDYFDKSLIVLSVTTGNISIASFETIIEAPVGIANANFSLSFSISTGIVKKTIKNNKK